MAWIEPAHSIQEVNAAGKVLVRSTTDLDLPIGDYVRAMDIINNWRGAHGYPLNTFQINLRNTSRRFDPNALVAQRIKRLWSIHHKLERLPSMKLSQMQDLGGCRAILGNVQSVSDTFMYYLNESAIKHELQTVDDYIHHPKASGYRGVHLVYRYMSDKNKKMYNGMKIELQIRSRYQHAWATAVETVGMFSGQALKSSMGSADWKRFFSLMGSAIAIRERSALVPNTPTVTRELISELADLASKLQVEHRLAEYNKAIHSMATSELDAHYYLMQLEPETKTLKITGFSHRQAEIAGAEYAKAEQEAKGKPGMDAVLVSVDSVANLAKAYPNYFADTRLFLELLKQALAGRTRSIRLSELKVG